MRKQDIYDFLLVEKQDLLKKKVMPLQEEYLKIKHEGLLKIVKDSGVDITELSKKAESLLSDINKINEKCSFAPYGFNQLSSRLIGLLNEKDILDIVDQGFYNDDIIEVREAYEKYHDMRLEINTEFDKINRAVKSLNTAKQAVKMLKQLGFDVNKIKSQAPSTPMVISVNNDVLDLPQVKNSDQSDK